MCGAGSFRALESAPMNGRRPGNHLCAVVLIGLACLAPPHLSGQSQPAAQKKAWTPARTPDGQPDFQGSWSTATLTPLERPAEFAGKEFLTPQEAAEYERRMLAEVNSDRRDGGADADLR